ESALSRLRGRLGLLGLDALPRRSERAENRFAGRSEMRRLHPEKFSLPRASSRREPVPSRAIQTRCYRPVCLNQSEDRRPMHIGLGETVRLLLQAGSEGREAANSGRLEPSETPLRPRCIAVAAG